ncbi:MAG: alpha/beta hydrolase [Lachnospiraceae bacterium]|nr:alpha/beta hydrolase [Lachnospiraceae bacterium]
MRTYMDIPYVENATEMQLLDMYLPDGDDFATVIWFHGGGFEKGSRKRDYFAAPAVERGYGFVSVEYRMYPDAKYPDFIEDAAASVAYVIKHIGEYGGNGKIYVSGASAGAYLTMMLCMDHRFLEAVGVKQEQIGGYISDSAQQFNHFNVMRNLFKGFSHISFTSSSKNFCACSTVILSPIFTLRI